MPPNRSSLFDMAGYAGLDLDRFVTRSLCSWDDAGWRSLLVQGLEQVDHAAEFEMPPSQDLHMWLMTKGAGRLHVDIGEGWSTTTIAPGQVRLAARGVPTRIRYETTEQMQSIHVHLPAGAVDRVSADLGRRVSEVRDRGPEMNDLLAAMITSLAAAASGGADELYAETAAQFLAVHVISGMRSSDRQAVTTNNDARVSKAIALMHDRLSEPVRLTELAEETRLSVYHFLRVFKQATGQTPGRYLRQLRVTHATRLLRGGMTVSQAAYQCGFSSPGHLSAAYLQHTGVRPSAQRLK